MESDETLIMALQAGDAAAFERLVRRHAPRFYGFAFRLCGVAADAEEVLQESFLKLWRNPYSWRPDGGGKFTTWFHRILINQFIDRRRRERPTEPDSVLQNLPDGAPNAETQLAAATVTRAVWSAIAALPDKQKIAIHLYYYDEHSQEDAAQIMGLKLKAYESLLHRARQNLKRTLAGKTA